MKHVKDLNANGSGALFIDEELVWIPAFSDVSWERVTEVVRAVAAYDHLALACRWEEASLRHWSTCDVCRPGHTCDMAYRILAMGLRERCRGLAITRVELTERLLTRTPKPDMM